MDTDIVVLGATGFTGQLVVEVLATMDLGVRWVITGRSREKLTKLQENLRDKGQNCLLLVFFVKVAEACVSVFCESLRPLVKGINISQIPQLQVDTTNEESLTAAVNNAKVVLNCVGPNTERSDDIVQACIRCRTHYVDISAEVNHIFNLHVKYHKTAEEANVLIIPACAYSSLVPASGLLYLQQQFVGTLNSVECYFELGLPKRAYIPLPGNCLASAGTWDSLVHVLRNMKEYQRRKAEMYPPLVLPDELKRGFFHCRHKKLWFPYPGADADVIEMSERYLQEKRGKRPVHFKLYSAMPLLVHYLIIPFMFLYYYLSYFNWFAKLLWRFPGFFTLGYLTKKGPSERNRDSTAYSFTYIGKGWDKVGDGFTLPTNKMVKVKLSSKDPYKMTAIVSVLAALTILKEQAQMPSGGVVNVGAAFCDTTIVERLMNNGIKYEVLS